MKHATLDSVVKVVSGTSFSVNYYWVLRSHLLGYIKGIRLKRESRVAGLCFANRIKKDLVIVVKN